MGEQISRACCCWNCLPVSPCKVAIVKPIKFFGVIVMNVLLSGKRDKVFNENQGSNMRQNKNITQRESSYYANAQVFCELQPLRDKENKNGSVKICK